MDNAAKALIMAGGVLIAIGIISVAIYFYSTASDYARASDEVLSVTQIQSFNRFYTAYSTIDGVRVIDAVNILNRALEDNLDDVNVVNNCSSITKEGDFYKVSDSTHFLDKVTYSIGYDAEGKVNRVVLGGE